MACKSFLWLKMPLAILLAAGSCSDQGEGARCDINSGTVSGASDCASDLVCVASGDLLDKSIGDRCCPPANQINAGTDSRCRLEGSQAVPATGETPGMGDTGSSEMDGTAGESGTTETGGQPPVMGTVGFPGGTAGVIETAAYAGSGNLCSYSSDCPGTEICGPSGHCQPQCRSDKDCPPRGRCDLAQFLCVSSGTGGAQGATMTAGAGG